MANSIRELELQDADYFGSSGSRIQLMLRGQIKRAEVISSNPGSSKIILKVYGLQNESGTLLGFAIIRPLSSASCELSQSYVNDGYDEGDIVYDLLTKIWEELSDLKVFLATLMDGHDFSVYTTYGAKVYESVDTNKNLICFTRI